MTTAGPLDSTQVTLWNDAGLLLDYINLLASSHHYFPSDKKLSLIHISEPTRPY